MNSELALPQPYIGLAVTGIVSFAVLAFAVLLIFRRKRKIAGRLAVIGMFAAGLPLIAALVMGNLHLSASADTGWLEATTTLKPSTYLELEAHLTRGVMRMFWVAFGGCLPAFAVSFVVHKYAKPKSRRR